MFSEPSSRFTSGDNEYFPSITFTIWAVLSTTMAKYTKIHVGDSYHSKHTYCIYLYYIPCSGNVTLAHFDADFVWYIEKNGNQAAA